jgi:hypothetical protein
MTTVNFLILTADVGTDPARYNMAPLLLGGPKVAWITRQMGYSAQVIQRIHLLTVNQIVEICRPFIGKGTVVGLSTTMLNWSYSLGEGITKEPRYDSRVWAIREALWKIRDIFGVKIVVGGPAAALWGPWIKADETIIGYVENTLPPLLTKWFSHGIQKKITEPWDIKTCQFRWHESDCIQYNESLPIETSRGCIFNCKFCAWDFLGKKKGSYVRNMDLIRDEMLDNYERFGTTNYWLMDATFNDDIDKVNMWCDMIEKLPFEITYSGFMRADLFYAHKGSARRLHDTGMRGICFGLETFHPVASKAIGKGWNAKHAVDYLPRLYEDELKGECLVFGSFIVGLPGETEDSLYKTAEIVAKWPWLTHKFNPLGMRGDVENIPPGFEISLFSREPEKYGYRFPDPNNPFYWVTDIMDKKRANELAAELSRMHYNRHDTLRACNWTGPMLATYGVEWNHILKTSLTNITHTQGFINSTNQFISKYFDDIMYLQRKRIDSSTAVHI